MRVLIVEDEDWRMLTFDVVFENDDVTRARTARDAERWLLSADFDLVMLDHDLGPGGDGQDVARLIASSADPNACRSRDARPFRVPSVFIHSWNPAGALAIHRILAATAVRTMRQPFGPTIGYAVAAFMEPT